MFYLGDTNLQSFIDMSLKSEIVESGIFIPANTDGRWTIGGSGKTSLTIGGSYIYPGELTVPGKSGRKFHVKEDGPYYGSCEINGSKISLKSAGGGLSEYASMIEMPSVRFYDHLGDYHKFYSDILLNEVSVWDSINSISNKQDKILDIESIREGARSGYTALQTAPVTSVNSKTGAM